jgi:hypothetical protein
MSPTSYQAAPPREFIIADAQRAVKQIEHSCERFKVLTLARGTAAYGRIFRAFRRPKRRFLLHVGGLDGTPLRGDVNLSFVGSKDRFELIGGALIRGAIVGIALGLAVRLRSD